MEESGTTFQYWFGFCIVCLLLFGLGFFFPQCVKEPNKKLLSANIFTE